MKASASACSVVRLLLLLLLLLLYHNILLVSLEVVVGGQVDGLGLGFVPWCCLVVVEF
jgi:hypothetical protein